jgi:hypothetical protein
MPAPTAISLKVLHKVQGEDPALNRFQDHVLGVLNPFMREVVDSVGSFAQVDTASLPEPSASYAGKTYRVKDKGQPEILKTCLMNANGTFSWADVGAGRASAWALLGVWVGATAPATGITYAEWLAGADGYWGWKSIP